MCKIINYGMDLLWWNRYSSAQGCFYCLCPKFHLCVIICQILNIFNTDYSSNWPRSMVRFLFVLATRTIRLFSFFMLFEAEKMARCVQSNRTNRTVLITLTNTMVCNRAVDRAPKRTENINILIKKFYFFFSRSWFGCPKLRCKNLWLPKMVEKWPV